MKLDLDQYVPGLLVWLANKMSASASELYRERFDIGVTDWRVLAYVYLYPWCTGTQVCQLIGLDKGAVSRSFSLMEKRGLVERRMDGLRKVEYAVTDEGRAMYDAILPLAQAREKALLTGYSKEEKKLLVGMLHRLLANLPAVERAPERHR